MERVKKITKILGIFVLAAILVAITFFHFAIESKGSLKWAFFPSVWTRAELLSLTPAGTTKDACINRIQSSLKYDSSNPIRRERGGALAEGMNSKQVGKSSIVIKLSSYRFKNSLLTQEVYASYAFDGDGRLLDILIEKTCLGP